MAAMGERAAAAAMAGPAARAGAALNGPSCSKSAPWARPLMASVFAAQRRQQPAATVPNRQSFTQVSPRYNSARTRPLPPSSSSGSCTEGASRHARSSSATRPFLAAHGPSSPDRRAVCSAGNTRSRAAAAARVVAHSGHAPPPPHAQRAPDAHARTAMLTHESAVACGRTLSRRRGLARTRARGLTSSHAACARTHKRARAGRQRQRDGSRTHARERVCAAVAGGRGHISQKLHQGRHVLRLHENTRAVGLAPPSPPAVYHVNANHRSDIYER